MDTNLRIEKRFQNRTVRFLLYFCIFIVFYILLVISIRNVLGDITPGTDYYTFYVATRSYLFANLKPYSHLVTETAQLGIYGRLAFPWEDQVAFSYPFFMIFPIAPFSWMDIAYSQSAWFTFNLLIFLLSITLIFQSNKIYILTALFFYPIAFGLILGNLSNLILVIYLFVYYNLIFKRSNINVPLQIILGFLLFWTTGKPQLSWLLFIFALFISIKLRLRWVFFSCLFSGLTTFVISLLLYPDWIQDWILQINRYSQYNQANTPLLFNIFNNLLPTQFAVIGFAGIVSVILVFSLWKIKKFLRLNWIQLSNDNSLTLQLIFLLAFVTMVSLLLHPRPLSYDQAIFFIPFFLWVKTHYKIYPILTSLFWVAGILLLWIAFYLTRILGFEIANVIIPMAYLFGWMFVILLQSVKRGKERDHAPA